MSGLVARLELMPDELVQVSFLSRIAGICGCLSASQFCREVGIDHTRLRQGDHGALRKLAALSGAEFSRLQKNALVSKGTHSYEIRGCLGHSAMFRTDEYAICPECIAQDVKGGPAHDPFSAVHLRIAWHLRAIETCAIHQVALITLPLRHIKYDKRDFAVVGWNAAVDMISAPQKGAVVEPSAFEIYLSQRLERQPEGDIWLDRMTLFEVQKLCEVFGIAKQTGEFGRAKHFPAAEMNAARAAGYAVLREGPAAMHDFLSDRLLTMMSGNRVGIRSLLGAAAELLDHKANRTADFSLFRGEIAAFAAKWGLASADNKRLHSIPLPAELSLQEAADLHDVSPEAMQRAMKRLGMATSLSTASSEPKIKMNSTAWRKVVKETRRRWTNVEARRLLNVSNGLLWSFAEDGVLGNVEREDKSRANRLFDGDRLEMLMEDVRAAATSTRSSSDNWISLTAAAMMYRVRAARILKLVVERQLSKVLLENPRRGLDGLQLCADEVFQQLFDVTWRSVSVREVSRMLGTTLEVTRALVNDGQLECVRAGSSGESAKMYISETSAIAFDQRYVTLTRTASEQKISPRRLLSELAARGVQPAFPRDKFGAIFLHRQT